MLAVWYHGVKLRGRGLLLDMAEDISDASLAELAGQLLGSSAERRANAARKIAELTVDRKNETIRTRLAEAGAIPGLVRLLGSSDGHAGDFATQALFHLARSKANRELIRLAGGIEPLSGLLSSGPASKVLEPALLALINLSNNCAPNREAMCTKGKAVQRLSRLLGSGKLNDKLLGYAVMLVERLIVTKDSWAVRLKDVLREAGGIHVFAQLLADSVASPESSLVQNLVSVLASVVNNHTENREVVREAYAIPMLVQVLQAGPALPAVESATAALASLATGSTGNKKAIPQAGGIPQLVRLLSSGEDHAVTKNAVVALMVLTYSHPENRERVRRAGAVPLLVGLLQAGPGKLITEKATWTLSNLAQANQENQDAIREAGAIPVLVKLLESGDEGSIVKSAASAIASLCADNDSNREEAQEAGAVAPLLRLASQEELPAAKNAERALKAVSSGSEAYRGAIGEALTKASYRGGPAPTNLAAAPQSEKGRPKASLGLKSAVAALGKGLTSVAKAAGAMGPASARMSGELPHRGSRSPRGHGGRKEPAGIHSYKESFAVPVMESYDPHPITYQNTGHSFMAAMGSGVGQGPVMPPPPPGHPLFGPPPPSTSSAPAPATAPLPTKQ
ncbi:hypothetical protein CYMTET_55466 [Cymbomonas tetramitiformis]|uniref:U-box domain-containing protein n=1 Tax=Cymbomonas tetramitiformis TaxID=36881 RepID=A0AAE0BDA5_9CHLO|nr:hypothetical protein CYMTET_55466 [Cymbomonas tetramitiformis]